MSGAGKSSVVAELRQRGYDAHDVDAGLTHLDPTDERWHWDVPGVQALLDAADDLVLIAGCSEEQRAWAWDLRILLTAPADVLLSRVATRPGPGFGKSTDERALVLADIAEVEPLLLASADVVLDTRRPLPEVVDAVLLAVRTDGVEHAKLNPCS